MEYLQNCYILPPTITVSIIEFVVPVRCIMTTKTVPYRIVHCRNNVLLQKYETIHEFARLSSLKGHTNLSCIFPVLIPELPKQALCSCL